MDSIFFLIIVGGALALLIGLYNRLVRLRNNVRNGFAQVDVQLTRRYDLIPNLVESVKAYMTHERDTLNAVIKARNSAAKSLKQVNAVDPETVQSLSAAELSLTGSLGKLFALMESYPDLKANQNMLTLQKELSATEGRVALSRRAFNDAVMTYNTACESFPANLIAGFFGFRSTEFFEADETTVRTAPKVSFT